MGYLKGRSGTRLYEQFGELKYRSRELGDYVSTTGKNASRIAEYIAIQLKEDELDKQMTMNEFVPFTGGK
ncbi:MAG: hypothetical protein ACLSS9_07735 [Acutalibacteraceae bacterium]